MALKLSTNKISTGKKYSFEDFCNGIFNKTASKEESSVKTAEADEVSSGQLEWEGKQENNNNPESDQKKAPVNKGKKEEEVSSGQLEWEGKQENNNDPETKESDTQKEAGSKKGPGVPDGTGPGKDSKECPFSKKKKDDDSDDDDKDKDEDEEDNEKDTDKKTKEADVSRKWVRLAELTPASKKEFYDYWKELYPNDDPDYVKAMLSDK